MLYNKSIDKFFSEESMLDFSTMIYRIPALLFAITIHEYAHAQCADSMGDPTGTHDLQPDGASGPVGRDSAGGSRLRLG